MTKLEQAIACFDDVICETISKQDGPFMAVLMTSQQWNDKFCRNPMVYFGSSGEYVVYIFQKTFTE
jgi:hypothetical protein